MRKIVFLPTGRRKDCQASESPVVANPQTKNAATTRHFVYIVMCADGTLYTGYTTDPRRRVDEHNAGRGARYTSVRRPVELAFLEEAKTRSMALRREIAIKKLSKSGKLLLCRKYRGKEKLGLR